LVGLDEWIAIPALASVCLLHKTGFFMIVGGCGLLNWYSKAYFGVWETRYVAAVWLSVSNADGRLNCCGRKLAFYFNAIFFTVLAVLVCCDNDS
jgi:hypothetical protein